MNTKPNKGSFQKGHVSFNKGKKYSPELKKKLSESKLGEKNPQWKGGISSKKKELSKLHLGWKKGENSHNWIKDRTKLKKSEKKHLDTNYKYWMLQVKSRDKWKCRLENDNCKGRLEAHHIYNWADYEELRYIINNGITLCRFHHPLGWEEEKRMIPIFQELLSVSNE